MSQFVFVRKKAHDVDPECNICDLPVCILHCNLFEQKRHSDYVGYVEKSKKQPSCLTFEPACQSYAGRQRHSAIAEGTWSTECDSPKHMCVWLVA